MPKRKIISHRQPLDMFYETSRQVFGEQYQLTGRYSILAAQNMLESAVEKSLLSVDKAMGIMRDPTAFAKILLDAENDYQEDSQNDERQKLHKRMAKIERSTHWAIAVGLGLTFLAAGSFASALLQPTADELFKRAPAGQPAQNVTNNVYNFYAPGAATIGDKKYKVTLDCKNMTVTAYKASLPELLQNKNVVTLELNGKKVSMCYRPHVQPTGQQQVLAKK